MIGENGPGCKKDAQNKGRNKVNRYISYKGFLIDIDCFKKREKTMESLIGSWTHIVRGYGSVMKLYGSTTFILNKSTFRI